jgi:molybdopterin synthase sulfur carrier subunit
MSGKIIKIKVKLFAVYQETFGKPELELTCTQPISVGNLLNFLIKKQPQLQNWQNITRFGVNLKFVDSETLLQDGDEVVLIPPVSGG